jgi:putative transposase
MSRYPRTIVPNVPLHITQRGNNRLPSFFCAADFLVYLDLLRNAASESSCQVHAFVLMTNHVHLLISPSDTEGPAALMKSLGERYVQYVNRRHGRTGTLWEGRYRSCLVQCERYLMVCHRYIELNPVRAGMVSDPLSYLWSSYRCNAYGEPNAVISPHALYTGLGDDGVTRERAYRELCNEALGLDMLKRVRIATQRSTALGSPEFAHEMSNLTGQWMSMRDGGRPRKYY